MRLAKLREAIRQNETVVEHVYYRRPYTTVVLAKGNLTGVGTAKVSWPDRWSDRKGYGIAYGKAELDLAQQMSYEDTQPSDYAPLADALNSYWDRTLVQPLTAADLRCVPSDGTIDARKLKYDAALASYWDRIRAKIV